MGVSQVPELVNHLLAESSLGVVNAMGLGQDRRRVGGVEVNLHILVVCRRRVEGRRRAVVDLFAVVIVEATGDDVIDGLEVLGVDTAHEGRQRKGVGVRWVELKGSGGRRRNGKVTKGLERKKRKERERRKVDNKKADIRKRIIVPKFRSKLKTR